MNSNIIYYTIYKITNTLNNKIYIGMHKTSNLDDNYYGSGKIIRRAVLKYGKYSFKKEYLAIFNNKAEMIEAEKELVNEVFVDREDTYNLKLGGSGGFDLINKTVSSETKRTNGSKGGEAFAAALKNNKLLREKQHKRVSGNFKRMHLRGDHDYKTFKGRKHTEVTKEKISKAMKGRCSKEANSQYGTCWIYNSETQQNRKIHSSDIGNYTNCGWERGRKIKK